MTLVTKLAFSAAVFLAFDLFAELVVRIVAPQPMSAMAIYRSHPTKPMFGVATNVEQFADTGESQWHVFSDHHGLRIGKGGRRNQDAPQVLVIGDSFTFGYAVEYEESYPAILDDAVGDGWEVINAGQPGYGPIQYRMLLEDLLASGFAPESIVLAVFVGNDIFDVMIDKDQPVRDGFIGNPGGIKFHLKQNSHLYRMASRAYHTLTTPSAQFIHSSIDLMKSDFWEDEDIEASYEVYKAELARFKEICDERGIELYLAIIPPAVSVDYHNGVVQAEEGSTTTCRSGSSRRAAKSSAFRTWISRGRWRNTRRRRPSTPSTGTSTRRDTGWLRRRCWSRARSCRPPSAHALHAFRVERVSVPVEGGASVPMLVAHRGDLQLDETHSVLLSGSGGLGRRADRGFNRAAAVWIESGGVWASADLRGGGGFGADWRRDGMREGKLNAVEDLLAAAEWLTQQPYAEAGRLGLRGEGDGGLLAAAALTRRPDLFAAVVTRHPLIDMLRYQLFLGGPAWISEYGSADAAEQFEYLRRIPLPPRRRRHPLPERHAGRRRRGHPYRPLATPAR